MTKELEKAQLELKIEQKKNNFENFAKERTIWQQKVQILINENHLLRQSRQICIQCQTVKNESENLVMKTENF